MARVEKTPLGMWPLWKKEGEILPLSLKLILQHKRGNFILAGSCLRLIGATYCAIVVSDNNVQSTVWRQILWDAQGNLVFPGGIPSLSLP